MKLYLAGPMRGVPEFNYPLLDLAAARLRELGHEVFNPADQDRAKGMSPEFLSNSPTMRRQVFKEDTSYICEHAEAVVLLPGWENSRGARAEHALAVAIGITVIILPETFFQ